MRAVPLVVASLLVAIGAPRLARANPYEAFIDIRSTEDLDELLAAEVISDDTYDALSTLLARGVELSRASREALYSLPNLTYADVDAMLAYRANHSGVIREAGELAAAGVLSTQAARSIAPFVAHSTPASGFVHGFSRVGIADSELPPTAAVARLTLSQQLTLGAAFMTTRLQVGSVSYDPTRDALLAAPQGGQWHLPKAYARFDSDDYAAIIGSYRVGFGQRLVFDNSLDYTPNGLYLDDRIDRSAALTRDCTQSAGELAISPCAGAPSHVYVTPDFQTRDGLFGVAGGVKRLVLGDGYLQLYGFASYQRKSIYQYNLTNAVTCTTANCSAPSVFARPLGDDPELPTSRDTYKTLPNVFGEALLGGNVTYFASNRSSIGVTAYGATLSDLIAGIDLGLQKFSQYPGLHYGALGANFALGRSWFDVFGEVAQSVARISDVTSSGGVAAVLRATASAHNQELELAVRYLGTSYANPYARPIDEADEYQGERARDEAGARLRYYGRRGRLTLRTSLDFWVSPSSHTPKINFYNRADFDVSEQLRLGLWTQYEDKDLGQRTRGECFDDSIAIDDSGKPVPCTGLKFTNAVRASYRVSHSLTLQAHLQHWLYSDPNHPDGYRNDLAAWFIAIYQPSAKFRIRARTRYLHQDLTSNTNLEQSLWSALDATIPLRRRDVLRVRVDLYWWLDQRASTLARDPNPEISLSLQYEANF